MTGREPNEERGVEMLMVISAILLAVAIFFVAAEIGRRLYLSLW